MASRTRRVNRKRSSTRKQRKEGGGNNNNSNNSNNNASGLTVGELKKAIKDLADKTPVYHVEFGGITRSNEVEVEKKKRVIIS